MNHQSGPEYWKSLDEKASSPEFQEWVEREFPEGASELSGVNRRQFLKVMAASFSLAGVGAVGCRRPRKHVLPYSKQPENIIQGVPNFYSSSYPQSWGNIPVIVESHQGRPTKIEGNPSYKRYRGGTDAFTQASVLDLYDPDRLKVSKKGTKPLSKAQLLDLLSSLKEKIKTSKGKGIAVLAEPSSSPSRAALVAQLTADNPELIWAEYEAVQNHGLETASKKALGKSVRALYHLEKAKKVLSLDSDFLGLEPDSLGQNKSFAKARKVRSKKDAKKMNRLYTVESSLTLTGATADHRLRLSSTEVDAMVALIASIILEKSGGARDLTEALKKRAHAVKSYRDWAEACADDLLHSKGQAAVLVGGHLSAESQMLGIAINQALEAEGATVDYLEIDKGYEAKGIADLAEAVKSGSVETLFILGGNPAYDAPADLDFSLFAKTVKEVIRFGSYEDESSVGATYQIAASHYLESWGDGRTFDGKYVPVQPLIEPLYQTISELELVASLAASETTDAFEVVKKTAGDHFPELAQSAKFSALLAEGVYNGTEYPVAKVKASSAATFVKEAIQSNEIHSPTYDSLEVRIAPSYHTYDGRYANNGWLLECPEPLTKLTWDNAILISPYLAKELEKKTDFSIFPNSSLLNDLGVIQRNKSVFVRGQEEAPVAKLSINGTSVEGPIHVQPGLANYTVVIDRGFGRDFGRIAQGNGFDANPLTTLENPSYRGGAKLELLGTTYPLANTQEHWSMEGRAIIREGTTKDYLKQPDFVSKMGTESHSPAVYGSDADKPQEFKAVKTPRGGSMYDPPNFEVKDRFNPDDPNATWAPQQWGMTIDLNTCTGCNACVVACQSENNIPIVGKDQVRRGREMHWIRLDRYYSSANVAKTEIPDDVQVSFQGMACTHCELAPCETVCPVNATVHDKQGLNVMAYNRCVGTRYCANNCPYKVRRFNFFDWNKREIGKFYQGPLGPVDEPETQSMQRNPDVTVRMRGVMEKCTYCVQRIESAKIRQKSLAKNSDNVNVPDGNIQVACQQVCPADCIEFGDITDPNSKVYKAKESDLNYSVLGYLNIRPRTTYLAKLRNPNPEMPEKYRYDTPYTRAEYKAKSHGGGNPGDHGADHHAHGHDSHGHEEATHHEPQPHH
ncbi:MAG: TAT-variant-translocated molybdopterin oxidoreductase [Opitutales bacterium]|nr:TAT-variant-translocated molybdopterin oxidoreductase [Opitutales bacterium]